MSLNLNMLNYEIYFGQTCNNNCIMCTNVMPSKQKPEPLSEQIKKIKSTLSKDSNAPFFGITGGEPTLYPKQLHSVMKFIQDNSSAEIKLITNARMFYYSKFCEIFKDINPKRVVLITEIHGPKDLHEKITGVKGSFKQTVEGIKNIKKILGWFVEQRLVLHRLNFQKTEEIVQIGHNLGVTKFVIFPIDIVGNAARNRRELMITYSELIPNVLSTIDYCREHALNVVLLHIPKCVLPSTYWKFAAGESVVEKRLDLLDSCKNCILQDSCAKPWKSYTHFVGNFEFEAIEYADKKYLPFFMSKRKLEPGLNIINASGACNQRCVFCTYDKFLRMDVKDPAAEKPFFEKPSLDSSLPITDIVKRILQNENEEIVFMGGEPTLNKDLPYLVKFAKKYCKKVTVNTNGVLLSSFAFAHKLKTAGLDRLMISLHGHTAEVSEKISRIKGNFIKTVKGIHNAIDLGINIMLVHVLYKENYVFFQHFVNFVISEFYHKAKQKNLSFGLSVSMVKPNRFSSALNKEITPKYSQVLPYLIKGLNKLKNLEIDIGLENFPLCQLPENFRKFSVEFNEIKSFGNFDKWLEQRLRNNERDVFGYKSEDCLNCKFYNFCQGLLKEYAEVYGNSELKPIN